jgi:RNA polymerase sigma-70 factor (ECF subfamily)
MEPALEQTDDRTSGSGDKPPNPARLRVLVDSHFDFIWRSLRRLGLPDADADDAAQRVFWIASRKLGRIEHGKERAFLFGTACHVAREARRARGRRREDLTDGIEVEDATQGAEELVDRNKAREVLDRVLDSMSLDVRAVFVLFEIEEMTVPAIAELLDVPAGTVASRLRRGRELFHAAAARFRAREARHGGTP